MKKKFELTLGQAKAKKTILRWLEDCQDWDNHPHVFTLGGYAGTGKTTLIADIVQTMKKANPSFRVAFCTYTGKASGVLKKKVFTSGAFNPDSDFIGTIHRFHYQFEGYTYDPSTQERKPSFALKKPSAPDAREEGDVCDSDEDAEKQYDLIIVDEASMVRQDSFNDLLSHSIPILAVGDHGQLPPVETERNKGAFNLMGEPMLKLEDIVRQAIDNPIIKLSMEARQSGRIAFGKYDEKGLAIKTKDFSLLDNITDFIDSVVIAGKNDTRISINCRVRRRLKFDPDLPCVGDRVLCLVNEPKNKIDAARKKTGDRLYNGSLGTVTFVGERTPTTIVIGVDLDDGWHWEGQVLLAQFNEPKTMQEAFFEAEGAFHLFDFGYCLTCHKSQGSEWKRAYVIDESAVFRFKGTGYSNRWLYTAVTRAREELIIIGRE